MIPLVTSGGRPLRQARLASQAARSSSAETYAAQGLRQSGQPGRRFQALAVLAEAARIRPGPDLRDEAIACMALVDLRASLVCEWGGDSLGNYSVAFDRPMERDVRSRGNLASVA